MHEDLTFCVVAPALKSKPVCEFGRIKRNRGAVGTDGRSLNAPEVNLTAGRSLLQQSLMTSITGRILSAAVPPHPCSKQVFGWSLAPTADTNLFENVNALYYEHNLRQLRRKATH